MEKARQELEEQARIRRQNENPFLPAEAPASEDEPVHTREALQTTPDEVIAQERPIRDSSTPQESTPDEVIARYKLGKES